MTKHPTRPAASWLPFGASDSLARHLLFRLLPPLLLLILLNLALTWFVSHKLDIEDWQLGDIIWLMLAGQLALIVALVVVVLRGVRLGMQSVRQLSEQIASRTPEDFGSMQIPGLPRELQVLVEHTNGLLGRISDTLTAQRRFVGHAAHQLKTPLAGLKLESELMLAKPLPEDIRQRAERIKNVTDRMIRMGKQLLVLARVDPEVRPQDNFVLLDLCEWIRTVGADWLESTKAAGIALQLEAPDQPVWVEGDPILLAEMLSNLIDNARRYAKGADSIKLIVTSTPPTLSVEDNGSGISINEQNRVFEAFYRSPEAQEGGSGLGLAIVREIARAHGAWWNLLSGPQLAGVRVTVVFPGPRKGALFKRLDRLQSLH